MVVKPCVEAGDISRAVQRNDGSGEGRIVAETHVQVFGPDYPMPLQHRGCVVNASTDRPTVQTMIVVKSEITGRGCGWAELRFVDLRPCSTATHEEQPLIDGVAQPAARGGVPTLLRLSEND